MDKILAKIRTPLLSGNKLLVLPRERQERIMKALYFCDPCGNKQEEKEQILKKLHKDGIDIKIRATNVPPHAGDFDILFFDWGGMSMGNDLMSSFCREWIKMAQENPSKIFVMASDFTKYAMKDALEYIENEHEKPCNIYLAVESAITPIKDFIGN